MGNMSEINGLSIWLFFIIAILSTVPIKNLLDKYKNSGIREFQLFAVLLTINSMNFAMFFSANFTDLFILWKLHRIFLEFTLLLTLIHSIRLVWTDPPKLLIGLIITWFVINVIIISQWKEIAFEMNPKVIFWFMTPQGYPGISYDLGFKTENDVIINSLRFTFISDFYYLLVAIVLTVSYFRVEPPNPTSEIMTAYYYMKLTVISVLVSAISAVFWTGNYRPILVGGFLLVGFIFMNYVSIKYPEIMLISHAQIIRAMKLYPRVKSTFVGGNNPIKDIPSLVKYIESLPEEITQSL